MKLNSGFKDHARDIVILEFLFKFSRSVGLGENKFSANTRDTNFGNV